MRGLSLFAGIGGFDIAAEWAGIEVAGMVEWEKFPQQVLRKHWPHVKLIGDIHDVRGDEFGPIDIVWGGPPCQPASTAGKRKGTADDRWLWPEAIRIVAATRPRWILFENPTGILSLQGGVPFDNVLSALESLGYYNYTDGQNKIAPIIIPAASVNAPHRRDRVWIVAHANGDELGTGRGQDRKADGVQEQHRAHDILPGGIVGADRHAADAEGNRRDSASQPEVGREEIQRGRGCGLDNRPEDAADTENTGLEGRIATRPGGTDGRGAEQPIGGKRDNETRQAWDEPWIEAAQRFCQLDDGLSYRLDGHLTFPETHGIMGLILTLRRYHYAATEKTRANEILSVLQEAFASEDIHRTFGRLGGFFSPEILRCPMHGERDGKATSNQVGMDATGKEVSREEMRNLRDNQASERPPQERGLHGQCSCEFDDIVCELSSKIALGEWKNNAQEAENILHGLWQESRGERFLHEPLSALHEIWRSVTDKEIGSFRRHYLNRNVNRVQRLKSAGNAIVPQVAFQIFRAIKATEAE